MVLVGKHLHYHTPPPKNPFLFNGSFQNHHFSQKISPEPLHFLIYFSVLICMLFIPLSKILYIELK